MSDFAKIRLLAMIDNEIEEVTGAISNNRLWMHGSDTMEEAAMFQENIAELEEYKGTLFELRKQIYGGKIDV